MKQQGISAKGVIRWFNRNGTLFGYIESTCGKEVYFDQGSMPGLAQSDLSVGDAVGFVIVENQFGEVARRIQRIGRYESDY